MFDRIKEGTIVEGDKLVTYETALTREGQEVEIKKAEQPLNWGMLEVQKTRLENQINRATKELQEVTRLLTSKPKENER